MVNKNLNKKYQYMIIVGVLTFLGLILSYFLIVSPLYKKSKELTAEAKQKQETLDQLTEKKAKLEELKEKEEQLQADAKKVEAALPLGNQVGRLFIQIDQIAKQTNGKVKSVNEVGATASTTATTANISKVSYTVPVDVPTYFNFKDFINKAENALRIMDISDMDIKTSGAFGVTLTANSFVRNK